MIVELQTIRANAFQFGLDRILEAYMASANMLERAYGEARDQLDQCEQSGADDWQYEDDVFITSTQSQLEQNARNAMDAIVVVREAFIISVFHFWERSARQWTKSSVYGYQKLRAESEKFFPINPELDNVNTLNNILKHDSTNDALKLSNDRPDYFAAMPLLTGNKHGLRIKKEHVVEVIEIVRSSLPNCSTLNGLHGTG